MDKVPTLLFIATYQAANPEILQKLRELVDHPQSRDLMLAAASALMIFGEKVDEGKLNSEIQRAMAEEGGNMVVVSVCLRLLNKDDKEQITEKNPDDYR